MTAPGTALRHRFWPNACLMAAQMDFLIGGYITVCSRIKHESSSSDEEHAAAKPSSTSHLPLLSSVGYKKTLRLTSEQLARALSSCRCNVGSGPAPAARAWRVPWTGGTGFPPFPCPESASSTFSVPVPAALLLGLTSPPHFGASCPGGLLSSLAPLCLPWRRPGLKCWRRAA